MKRLDPEKTAAFRFDGGPVGCLLTHGFTGSPFEMRELGEYLAGKNLTVLCRPLPGHGTTARDMLKTTWRDWNRACIENLAELSSKCDKLFLCGMSMGGTLSLHMAAHYAQAYNIVGVAAYAAPIYLKNPLLPLLPLAKRVLKFKPPSDSDVADPEARARQESYGHVPLECLASLLEFLAHVKHDLQEIRVPVLLIQSRMDNTVHPPNARLIHSLLGSGDKTLIEVERSFHVVTVDYDKEILKEKTYEFIRRIGNPA